MRKEAVQIHKLAVTLLVMLLLFTGCGGPRQSAAPDNQKAVPAGDGGSFPPAQQPEPEQPAEKPAGSGIIKVHFLDVGQADSILVQLLNGQVILIDAGNNDDGPFVVSYLKQQGIKKIDYLVGTHPHEDHIGGLDEVIRAFETGRVFMPRTTAPTKTFEDILMAIEQKGLKINTARAGVTVVDQGGLKVNFVAPAGSGYEDLNNWSAVTRIQYDGVVFLLTGDAEAQSEKEMLASGANLKADVLKAGHHGSSTSTTPAFLKAVAPKYAVIPVGAGNDYGHPHKETLARLKKAGVQVYRTDLNGTVVFTSDGKTVTVDISRKQKEAR